MEKLGPQAAPFSELEQYEYSPPLPSNSDPLLWWKEREHRFPILSSIAKKYLCIPATSVPCERLFSDAGNIVTTKRASLDDDTVEQLLFLYENKDLIDQLIK